MCYGAQNALRSCHTVSEEPVKDGNESALPPGDWPPEDMENLGQCPICKSTDRFMLYDQLIDKIFFSAPGIWKMWRCENCGVGYLDPRPTVESIGRAYTNYYTHGDWQTGNSLLGASQNLIKWLWHALRND